MLEHFILYVVVEDDLDRRIQAVCATAEEAEKARAEIRQPLRAATVQGLCATELEIFAMKAAFTGDRYRLVYGVPREEGIRLGAYRSGPPRPGDSSHRRGGVASACLGTRPLRELFFSFFAILCQEIGVGGL
jgi:hypothetical protein